MDFSLPKDTFLATGLATVLYFKASLQNAPLPNWMRFDPVRNTFSGSIPVELRGKTLMITVVARYTQGNEASATVKLQIS